MIRLSSTKLAGGMLTTIYVLRGDRSVSLGPHASGLGLVLAALESSLHRHKVHSPMYSFLFLPHT
jgi:hypothetical protein